MTSNSQVRRLLPDPVDEITIEAAYTAERSAPEGRPWVGLCMVSSLDGTISVDGTSGGLGNRNDLDVLLTLRGMADMVLVGAGTVRDEGYSSPRRAGQRFGVVTNSGRVDLDHELFTSGTGFLITTERADIDESRVDVLRAGHDHVDLAEALRRVREIDPDVGWVQAEGGAALNGSLLDADVVDELALTLSPNMVGGDGPRLSRGADEKMRNYELAHLLTDDDQYVFTRYLRRRG